MKCVRIFLFFFIDCEKELMLKDFVTKNATDFQKINFNDFFFLLYQYNQIPTRHLNEISISNTSNILEPFVN